MTVSILSTLIQQINRNLNSTVITIEDPIEFLHKDDKSMINQREVGSDTASSPHLRSRHEVGRILRESGVPTVEFRASIIIGSGSLSFELIRALVKKLPVMVTRLMLLFLLSATNADVQAPGHRILGNDIQISAAWFHGLAAANGNKWNCRQEPKRDDQQTVVEH